MGQEIFNSTNLIMPHQFVQNKFVQEFVTVSLLNLSPSPSKIGQYLYLHLLLMSRGPIKHQNPTTKVPCLYATTNPLHLHPRFYFHFDLHVQIHSLQYNLGAPQRLLPVQHVTLKLCR